MNPHAEAPRAEAVVQFEDVVRDEAGNGYVARVYRGRQPGGLWEAWFVFFPVGGGRTGLQWTFVVMLLPLGASAWFLFRGLGTYPQDVATADASVRAIPAR